MNVCKRNIVYYSFSLGEKVAEGRMRGLIKQKSLGEGHLTARLFRRLERRREAAFQLVVSPTPFDSAQGDVPISGKLDSISDESDHRRQFETFVKSRSDTRQRPLAV